MVCDLLGVNFSELWTVWRREGDLLFLNSLIPYARLRFLLSKCDVRDLIISEF